MKRNFQVFLLLILFTGFTACQKPQSDILYQKEYVKEIKEARKEAGFFMTRNFIPGANIAVMKNGELIYSEGIGLASKDLDVKATRETKFRIGTLSEVFTSAIFRKMAAAGTVVPDSGIWTYLPQFPEKEMKFTLENLANEMAGLRPPQPNENIRRELNISLEYGLRRFMNDPLDIEPGTYQMPGVFNYNLLGVALEKAGRKSYHQLLEELTDTLQLENTVIDHPLATIKNRSDFFELNLVSMVVNGLFYDLRQNAPSEGILSTADDLAKFGNALLTSEYFDDSRADIFKRAHFKNGLLADRSNGWMIFKDGKDRQVYGRQGSLPGGSASLIIYPEEELVVAFACNLSSSLDDTPVFLIAKPFLGEISDEASKTSPLD